MTYAIELWTEYGIGMFFFTIRFFARYKAVGFRGLAWDDLFSFIAMVEFSCYFYVLSANISVSCYGALMPSHFKSLVKSCESPAQDNTLTGFADTFGSFVGLNDQTAEALSDHTAARYKVGSQSLFCAWISYVSLIWALKASLLCFYSRITLGLWQLKLVKIMAYISFVAYIAVMLELFLHCTPIQKNWQIKPYPGVCGYCFQLCPVRHFKRRVGNPAPLIFYKQSPDLRFSTDIGILAIPLPIVWKVKIPMRRKIVIGLLLSSGIFVITAAVLRCVLTLAETQYIGVSTIWASRETFVSLIAISAPAIKPLFNKNSWVGSSNSKNGASSGRFKKFSGNNLSGVNGTQTMKGNRANDLETGSSRKGPQSIESEMELKDISYHGSEENIIDPGQHNSPLEINVTTAYALDNEEEDHSPTTAGAREGGRARRRTQEAKVE
ncbi:hypothetical protein LARI1_G006733 [Lachnellula arida]|uniref:Rhodopsin domain-containing protein n=1 Tax=Lachnellula arida TaxID=1316785 RepID=A0A8T9B7H8_9HELO|nr:hypothetical protein LARI1_G006733 [Lachnellula arida]